MNKKMYLINLLPFLITKKLYLNQKKNHKLLIISIFSKLGISISVFALIMSLSALNGFYTLLNQTIFSSVPHGIIQFNEQSCLTWKDVIKKIKLLPDIVYAEPYLVSNGFITKKNMIKMIEIKSFKNMKYLKKTFLQHASLINSKKKIILLYHRICQKILLLNKAMKLV
jgi:lipoprotein-releasing system permease protein